MNRHYGKMTMALLVAAVLSLGVVSGTWAQEGSFAKQIQGSWALVSCVNEQDGKKTDVFGPNPKGIMMYTPEGRISFIMVRSDLPKVASNNRFTGTAEENKAIVQGSMAEFGTYKVVNEKEGKIMVRYEGGTFANWNGMELPRVLIVNGDEMKQINPTAAVGGTNYLIWKRIK